MPQLETLRIFLVKWQLMARVEALQASEGGKGRFAPEKKALGWAVFWGIVGMAAGEILPILGAVNGAKLGALAGGTITWYQARFGSRRSS